MTDDQVRQHEKIVMERMRERAQFEADPWLMEERSRVMEGLAAEKTVTTQATCCDACRFWREMQAAVPIIGQTAQRRGVCDKLTGKDSKLSLITNNAEARFAVMTADDFGCVQFGAKS